MTSDRLALRLLAAGLLVATAVIAACATRGGSVAPLQSGPAFNHAAHIEKGLECVDCHEGAEEEDEAGMPDYEFCLECHEDIDEEQEDPAHRSTAFLSDPEDPESEPQWHRHVAVKDTIVFSHAKHYDKDVACTDCHKGIEESERTGPELAASLDMDGCMGCHASKGAPNECATCHTDIGPGWMPGNHQRMWTTLHGQIARRDSPTGFEEDCSFCHERTFCVTCHQANPPRDHSEAWRANAGHGMAASMDRQRCATCHQPDACIRCHEQNAPRSHRASWGSTRNRHCLSSCHLPLSKAEPGGCGVCHRGTPSHDLAPRKPAWHRPDFDCLQCHTPMPHAEDGTNCNVCHR